MSTKTKTTKKVVTATKTVAPKATTVVTKTVAKRAKLSLTEKLEVITPRLRKGDFTLIAELTNYHPTMVSKVLRGKANNPSGEIINTAYTKFNKRKPATV